MGISSEWVLVAKLLRPQGRKGEVLADLLTDFPERFATHPEVWLAPAGFVESQRGHNPNGSEVLERAEVSAYWLPVGRNAGRIVLHLAGFSTINQAETLAGFEVVIRASERLPLEDGAVYISELVGAAVYDGNTRIGVVEDVEFATTPDGGRRLEEAAPLLNVRSASGEEILIPFVSAYLNEMDLAGGAIRMTLPEGLVGVNQSSATVDPPSGQAHDD